MKKEEILAMEAGKELDILIVKEIIGGVGDGYPTVLSPTPSSYSTDISAAWQVVKALRNMKDEKGHQLLCCLKIHCDIPGEAWDIHWSYSELSIMEDGHKDHKLPLSWFSLPEAICKAALLIKYSTKKA